jgi:hypothetical protein
MRYIYFVILFLFQTCLTYSQGDSLTIKGDKINKNIIWFIPSAANNIYGIALGPFGSESICNLPYTRHSHGINIQIIGQGIFQPFMIGSFKFDDFYVSHNDTNETPAAQIRAIHNGILLSPFGTFTDKVNGISFSLCMSMGKTVNGLSINLLWNAYEKINGFSIGLVNHAAETKGIQIGLVNISRNLKGVQIGVWNKNKNRGFPIINWSVK